MIERCECCGRKIARCLSPLTGTLAERDGVVVELDGRTCRICLREQGFAPVGERTK